MNLPTLVLASKSPRRKQILEDAGFKIKVIAKDTDESYPEDLDLHEVPVYIAKKKAKAFLEESNKNIVITADTVVLLEDMILGKPTDEKDAFGMLSALSGRKHEVITGVCLLRKNKITTFSEITEVYFRHLKKEEIEYYIKKYQPYDKAGGYGIQEWIGVVGVSKIVGSYYNVMGLPIEKVYRRLTMPKKK